MATKLKTEGTPLKKEKSKKITGIFMVFIMILIMMLNFPMPASAARTVTPLSSGFSSPEGVAVDSSGNIYTPTTFAPTYLSLGDSIAYGMSATAGSDYVDLLYNHLLTTTTYSSLSLNNLAVSGDTSSDLLTRLQTAHYIAAVENAKVITLSIGGDNLLSPVIGAVATAFGVNPVNNPNLMTDLAAAMAVNPNKDTILMGIANSPSLAQALQSGISQFSADFPQIIGTLKTLSPQAQIYVLNLYNPFNSQDPLYTVFDILINGINQGIRNNAVAGYEVADVYTEFKTTPGVVNLNLATIQLDPHPTTVGHAAIYQAILDVESGQIPATYHHAVSIGSLTGGSITASPTTTTSGAAIILTITPNSGMQLKAGTLKYNDGTTDYAISGTSFSMPPANVTITAVFEAVPSGIPVGTVIFVGNGQALDLEYANNPANIDEVRQDVLSGGSIYVITFAGQVINNSTGVVLTNLSTLPAVTYKDANGNIKHFASGDGPEVTTGVIV